MFISGALCRVPVLLLKRDRRFSSEVRTLHWSRGLEQEDGQTPADDDRQEVKTVKVMMTLNTHTPRLIKM